MDEASDDLNPENDSLVCRWCVSLSGQGMSLPQSFGPFLRQLNTNKKASKLSPKFQSNLAPSNPPLRLDVFSSWS